MNSKQRRKWLRENEPVARTELVHRTLQGDQYRHLPEMLNGTDKFDKVIAIKHLLRPQRDYT